MAHMEEGVHAEMVEEWAVDAYIVYRRAEDSYEGAV
jgi:hypothetical protein